MKSKIFFVLAVTLISCSAVFAGPTLLFSEDFEGGNLNQWTGKSGGSHSGQIVVDPLDSASNNVLNFTSAVSGGDVFTSNLITHSGLPVTIEFDYLGTNGDGAGFLGIAYDNPTPHTWLAGSNYGGLQIELVNNGLWNTYSLTINPATPFHIMIEDFRSPALNAYFDNIKVTTVPAPGALLLGSIGCGLVSWVRKYRCL